MRIGEDAAAAIGLVAAASRVPPSYPGGDLMGSRQAHTERVIVIDGMVSAPVYHRLGDRIVYHEPTRVQWYTACGHTIGWWSSHLRRDYVQDFTPCRRCYPEAS